MAPAIYRVTCKEKHSLYERITAISCINISTGSTLRILEHDAIRRIESGADSFFVEDAKGDRASVVVRQREGRKFLATQRDGIWDDNLLSLPECPAKKPTGSGTVRGVVAAASHSVPFAPYWGA
jgi:hypothetical protein